jgi:tripartite-type tricarboxylate transporter receptor subunit TctC
VNAPPDGYTLLLVGASSAINATLYEKLNFNFLRDIRPIAGIISIPFNMAVGPSFPAKTVSRVYCLCQRQSGQGQHSVGRADFGKLIADKTEKWGKVIRAANIKPE